MARRRRPGHRTSVVDGRAEIIVPVEAIENADGEPLSFKQARKWFTPVSTYPAVPPATPRVALTLDRFVFDLHLGDLAHHSDTHDGDVFLDAARNHASVTVFVAGGIDPRRSKPHDFATAARDGHLIAGLVSAFEVDAVDSP